MAKTTNATNDELKDIVEMLVRQQQETAQALAKVAKSISDNTSVQTRALKDNRREQRRHQELERVICQHERDLITAAEPCRYFRVDMGPTEKMMNRYVAVPKSIDEEADIIRAQRKFLNYFGITDISLDRDSPMHHLRVRDICGYQLSGPNVTAIDALPSMEDVDAWPSVQLKNLRGLQDAESQLAKMDSNEEYAGIAPEFAGA